MKIDDVIRIFDGVALIVFSLNLFFTFNSGTIGNVNAIIFLFTFVIMSVSNLVGLSLMKSKSKGSNYWHWRYSGEYGFFNIIASVVFGLLFLYLAINPYNRYFDKHIFSQFFDQLFK